MSSRTTSFSTKIKDLTTIDLFFANLARDSAHDANNIIQLGINITSIKKDITDYETEILNELENYPAPNSSIYLSIATFESFILSDPSFILNRVSQFFPRFVDSSNPKDIFSFFPKVPVAEDSLIFYLISYFSDAVFTYLAYLCIENQTALSQQNVDMLLSRCFTYYQPIPETNTLQYKVYLMMIQRNRKIIDYICQNDFFQSFSLQFNQNFQKHLNSPETLILYFNSINGLSFNSDNFSMIKDTLQQFLRLFDLYSKRIEVIGALCDSLYFILPQTKSFIDYDFIHKLEKKVEPYIKRLKESVSKLFGVIHYLQFTKKQLKLFERLFLNRIRKPEKVKFALFYILALFQPLETVTFNSNPELISLISEISAHMLEASVKNNDEKEFARVFSKLAYIDLSKFVNQWLPELLNGDNHQKYVAFLILEKILNPLNKEQSMIFSNENCQKYLINIIKQVDRFTALYFTNENSITFSNKSDFSLHYPCIKELMSKVRYPSELIERNKLEIPTKVLYFLLFLNNIDPIEQLNLAVVDKLKNSEHSCEDSLNQITKKFNFTHTSYGSIYQKLHINFGKFSKTKKLSFLLPFLQILPIMFHYSMNPNEYTQPLLTLILCNDVQIAVSASIVYELLLISFPNYSAFFINELVQLVKKQKKLKSTQLHRICFVFYHCLNISKNSLESSLDLIQEFSDYIAFNGLCSEHPETRLLSLEIMKSSTIFQQNKENTLKHFIEKNSNKIIQKAFISLLSEFSTDPVSVDQFPMISFMEALESPFILLWRFYFCALTSELINDENEAELVISVRESFIEHVNSMDDFIDNKSDIYFNSMKLLFLFSSSTNSFPISNNALLQKTWMSQTDEINQMIESYILSLISKKLENVCVFLLSFDFSSLHSDSLSDAISVFLEIEHNDTSLAILATFFHHISVQPFFETELQKMTINGQIIQLFTLLDSRLPIIAMNLTSVLNTSQLTSPNSNSKRSSKGSKRSSKSAKNKEDQSHKSEINKEENVHNTISNFLIFRGNFYKYLAKTRMIKALGPIPRCATPGPIEKDLISPILSKQSFFELLFQLSMSEKYETRIASRFCLSYFVSLGPLFQDDKAFSPTFFVNCMKIAKEQPLFLQYFLSNHLTILLKKFLMNSLTLPSVEEASIYLHAISAQFIPPGKKYSFVTSDDIFLYDQINDGDPQLAHFIYSETGTILLVGLIFLTHSSIHTRQASMRILAQLTPIICILHGDSTNQKLLFLMNGLKKMIDAISSDSDSIRLQFAIELSSCFSNVFSFATEQVIYKTFFALPKVWQARKCCRRDQIIAILTPWMTNVIFDLKSRSVVKNPSKFFVYFTQYSFVINLCECMNETEAEMSDSIINTNVESGMLRLWKELVMKPADENNLKKNISFLALAVCDIASSKSSLRKLATKIMTYLYRLSKKTINFVIPLISYSNWFFHHVQLGRFEEISDMSEYLKNGIGKRVEIDFEKANSKCNKSVDFALDVLENFVREDNIPFTFDNLCIVLAYCLTHINQKKAFDLLRTLGKVLKSSFDSGIPAVLRDVCELLDRIASVPFESLQFVTSKSDDQPLRLLQSRTVLVSSILELFIQVLTYFSADDDKTFEIELLAWGLTCGDLPVAARALDLYELKFATTETVFISHLIESLCIVIRCWMTSPSNELATVHSAQYIISVLRLIKNICGLLKEQNILQHYSIFYWITISILCIKGDIYPLVLNDCLLLMTDLLDNRIIEKKSPFSGDFTDFEPLLVPIVLNCNDLRILYSFIISLILKAPKELLSSDNDYSLYVILTAPLICYSLESSSALNHICSMTQFKALIERISDLYIGTHISTLCKQIINGEQHSFTVQEFSFNLIHNLNSLTISDRLEKAALLLSGLVRHASIIKNDSLFELGSALLSVLPSKEMVEGLSSLTYEATMNQIYEVTSSKIRLLQAISNFSNKSTIVDQNDLKEKKHIEMQIQWETYIGRIQDFVSKKLHQLFRETERVVKVVFDSIDTFPQIIPIEEQFLQCECFNKVMGFCSRIHVNPQSNWAFSLYCANELTEFKAQDTDFPDLQLDAFFEKEIVSVMKDVKLKNKNVSSITSLDGNSTDFDNSSEDIYNIDEEEEMVDSSNSEGNNNDTHDDNKKNHTEVVLINDNVLFTDGEGESLTYFVKLDAFIPKLDDVDSIFTFDDGKDFAIVSPS